MGNGETWSGLAKRGLPVCCSISLHLVSSCFPYDTSVPLFFVAQPSSSQYSDASVRVRIRVSVTVSVRVKVEPVL